MPCALPNPPYRHSRLPDHQRQSAEHQAGDGQLGTAQRVEGLLARRHRHHQVQAHRRREVAVHRQGAWAQLHASDT